MFGVVRQGASCLRKAVAGLEPGTLSGPDAVALVEAFAEVERLAAAGKALCARRVEQSRVWAAGGHRSAATWLAERTGESLGVAVGTLETARRLESLPGATQAYRSGELSAAQVAEVASAAEVEPGAEAELLATARSEGLAGLRTLSRRTRANAVADDTESYRRIHRHRRLRYWNDTDGAFRMDLYTTPDAGAVIVARLEELQRDVFAEARRAGHRESEQAYGADALVAMARCGDAGPSRPRSGPRAVVAVRVDHAALLRGHTEGTETCEIPGVGPIPVALARSLAADCVLKVLVTRGVDVIGVAHGGRSVNAHQRSAIEARDPECVVPGCHARRRLEIDHVDPWALTHRTSLDRLARLCHHHHFLKTFCGYRLDGSPGRWRFRPPETDTPELEPAAHDSG